MARIFAKECQFEFMPYEYIDNQVCPSSQLSFTKRLKKAQRNSNPFNEGHIKTESVD